MIRQLQLCPPVDSEENDVNFFDLKEYLLVILMIKLAGLKVEAEQSHHFASLCVHQLPGKELTSLEKCEAIAHCSFIAAQAAYRKR